MSFRQYTTSVSAAVATSGTFTFSLGAAAEWGQVKLEGNHSIYAVGLQRLLLFRNGDFTLSVSTTTVTVTYKATTSIPAGTTLLVQLECPGQDTYSDSEKFGTDGKDILGNPRWTNARLVRLLLGNPLTDDQTSIRAAAALAVTTLQTLVPAYVMDVPRSVAILSSGADTAVITIRGFDEYGVAVSEALTLNGNTAVQGNKAFKTVTSYQAATAPANNLSIGLGKGFGMPFFIPGASGNGGTGIGYVVRETLDGALATAGTLAGGDLTIPTSTTKDVRGLYTPNSLANGTRQYELIISASDVAFLGMPQYGL